MSFVWRIYYFLWLAFVLWVFSSSFSLPSTFLRPTFKSRTGQILSNIPTAYKKTSKLNMECYKVLHNLGSNYLCSFISSYFPPFIIYSSPTNLLINLQHTRLLHVSVSYTRCCWYQESSPPRFLFLFLIQWVGTISKSSFSHWWHTNQKGFLAGWSLVSLVIQW